MNSDIHARGTVVIAEDDVAVRKFVTRVLTSAGYDAIPTSNGLEALQRIQALEGKVDLIIADIRMPEGNGLDLGADIYASYPGIPVLYISGLTECVAVQAILARTPLLVLPKPFTGDALTERVDILLRARFRRAKQVLSKSSELKPAV